LNSLRTHPGRLDRLLPFGTVALDGALHVVDAAADRLEAQGNSVTAAAIVM
jgi:hypothetical protein